MNHTGLVDVPPDLRDAVLARESEVPSAPSNNCTGWRSAGDLLSWAPGARSIAKKLSRALGHGSPTRAWALVLRRGQRCAKHIHSGTTTVVVYLDDAGPGGAQLRVDGKSYRPLAGGFVALPASASHETTPHESDAPRVSLIFDFGG